MVRGIVVGLLAVLTLGTPAHARERAPGAPGGKASWASADKQGFGTAASRESRVWFTLRAADMTEVTTRTSATRRRGTWPSWSTASGSRAER